MIDEVARLQAQVDVLSDELRSAQCAIRALESRAAWRPKSLVCGALFIAVTLGIEFGTVHAAENASARSIVSSVNPPTKFTAPFEVVDGSGKPIFRVQELDDVTTKLPRGAFVYSVSGKPVVDVAASALGGGGGRVRVTSEADEQTYVTMAGATNVALLTTHKSGKETTSIGSNEGETAIKVLRNDGQKPAALLELKGESGALNVFGSGQKPVATIESDAGDGKLWISDKGGQQIAGVYANDDGGVVKVMKSGETNTYTAINAINAGLGMAIRKAGERLVFAGASGRSGEKGSVFVYGSGDSPIAGITSRAGGKGLVIVYNQAGQPISFLSENEEHPGGGDITVADPGGRGVFSAGFTGAGGDACVTRKNGLWCMGTNLPLQMH